MWHTSYMIDVNNKVTSVDYDTDALITELDVLGAISSNLLRKSVFKNMTGAGVRSYLRSVFGFVRHWQVSVTLPVAGVSARGLFSGEMTVAPLRDGALLIQHSLEESPHSTEDLEPGPRCAICASALDENETVSRYKAGATRSFIRNQVCTSCRTDIHRIMCDARDAKIHSKSVGAA